MFWKDIWCSEHPLFTLYPNLFIYTSDSDLLVIKAFENSSLQLSFTRQSTGILFTKWYNLHTQLLNYLSNPSVPNTLYWRWSYVDKFTVHSFYQWLEFGGIKNTEFNSIWLFKLSLKIKVFLYLLKRDKVLTKGNLLKKDWQDDHACPFCGELETTDHLFVQCSFINTIWQLIVMHNNFVFTGSCMNNVWFINASIPLKISN